MYRLISGTSVCAVVAALLVITPPAAANNFSTSHAGVTARWDDASNTLTVTGRPREPGWAGVEFIRPGGGGLLVEVGQSRTFGNIAENKAICMRIVVASGPGPYKYGTS